MRELGKVKGIVIKKEPSEGCSNRGLKQKVWDCVELAGTQGNKLKTWELPKGVWEGIRGTEVVAREGELMESMQVTNGWGQVCEPVVVKVKGLECGEVAKPAGEVCELVVLKGKSAKCVAAREHRGHNVEPLAAKVEGGGIGNAAVECEHLAVTCTFSSSTLKVCTLVVKQLNSTCECTTALLHMWHTLLADVLDSGLK